MVLYISTLAIGPLLRKMRPRALQGLDMARRARLGKVNCRYASPPRPYHDRSATPVSRLRGGRFAPGRQLGPALGLHELGPAPVQIAQIVLARFRLGQIHDPAGQAQPVPFVLLDFV